VEWEGWEGVSDSKILLICSLTKLYQLKSSVILIKLDRFLRGEDNILIEVE